MKKTLITGAAGFIGFHTAKQELKKGNFVIGIDNLNNYYDVTLKNERNKILKKFKTKILLVRTKIFLTLF